MWVGTRSYSVDIVRTFLLYCLLPLQGNVPVSLVPHCGVERACVSHSIDRHDAVGRRRRARCRQLSHQRRTSQRHRHPCPVRALAMQALCRLNIRSCFTWGSGSTIMLDVVSSAVPGDTTYLAAFATIDLMYPATSYDIEFDAQFNKRYAGLLGGPPPALVLPTASDPFIHVSSLERLSGAFPLSTSREHCLQHFPCGRTALVHSVHSVYPRHPSCDGQRWSRVPRIPFVAGITTLPSCILVFH